MIADIAILITVLLNATVIFLVGNKLLESFQGLVGNLVASVIVALVVFYAKRSG